ncbi:MAG: M56 family metallopeptidase [Draconibacterium sp.]
METLFTFLVNVSVGIILFYIVYWVFLRNETFYKANRWFLILALATAILLPYFPVKYHVEISPENDATMFKTISDTFKHIPVVSGAEQTKPEFNWQQGVLLIYLTGASIFLLRLLTQTIILIHIIIKYRVKSLDGIRIVENDKYGLPFSFFNVVFINPKFHKQENLPEILAHEKVHIRENHWFDLLFIELLTVIFWFNPFIWFFERSIKQNHEYLADKAVLAQGLNLGKYQALLINQLMGMQIIGITSNLNFALNKNRLKMMTKTKTSAFGRVKLMWALPAVALLLFAFAKPEYKVSTGQVPESGVAQVNDLIPQKTITVKGTVLDENREPLPGTSVVLKGGTVGTVCDIDGTFSLDIPENGAIVLSFVGKKTIEDSFEGITSEDKKEGVRRKYTMKDAISTISNNFTTRLDHLRRRIASSSTASTSTSNKKFTHLLLNKVIKVFYIVEDMPHFPGGYYAMQDYISKMQQIAQSKGI